MTLFLLGGISADITSNAILKYDIQHSEWKSMDVKIDPIRKDFAAVTIDDHMIYIMGGSSSKGPTSVMQTLDSKANFYLNSHTPLPEGRSELAATSTERNIYITGGKSATGNFLNTCYKFSLDLDHWERTRKMNSSRTKHGMAYLNGQIFVVGGYDGNSILNSIERHDPRSGSWDVLAPMSKALMYSSVVTSGNHLYVIGGRGVDKPLNFVQSYDTRNGKWEALASMNVERQGASAVCTGNEIYVVGGFNGSYLNSVEKFNVVEGKWSMAEPLPDYGRAYSQLVCI